MPSLGVGLFDLMTRAKKDTVKSMMNARERKRARDRKWREEHKELTKARARNWRDRHRHEKREYDRDYYLQHRDEIRARQKENAERITAQQRCYRATDTGRAAHRADQNRRSARKAELVSTLTQTEWQSALAHFGHRCAYCGAFAETLQQEHVIPLSAGGGYVVENIVPACARCNLSKRDSCLTEWMVGRGLAFVLPEALARLSGYFESALKKRTGQ